VFASSRPKRVVSGRIGIRAASARNASPSARVASRDAPHLALVEQVALVVERRHRRHVDPGERERAAPREAPERHGHQVAGGREEDRASIGAGIASRLSTDPRGAEAGAPSSRCEAWRVHTYTSQPRARASCSVTCAEEPKP